MTQSISLIGGQALRTDGPLETADLHLADGLIVDAPAKDSIQIDCRRYYVLPAIIDVHGDAFEIDLHPRPGVDIAFPIAMTSVDRQLVSNGIVTAFHGLTISWEPGARSLQAARHFMASLTPFREQALADHRVQLRWEVYAHEPIADLANWLTQEPTPAIAFNDHTTSTLEAMRTGKEAKLDQWARRAGVSLEDYLALVDGVAANAPLVQDRIRDVAALALQNDTIMLAHDEATVEEREGHRALGMQVSEFPLNKQTAASAVEAGEHVIMGAPNVLRGGSHKGMLSAEDAIREGLCTVLASDYYYPSLLRAAEHLVTREVLALADVWKLISANAAVAMGLTDRGTLETGKRADVIVLDQSDPWRIVHTIVGGSLVSFGQ